MTKPGEKSKKAIPRSALQKLERSHLSISEKETISELLIVLSRVTETLGEMADREDFYGRLMDALIDNVNLLSCIQQPTAELDALKRISFNLTASLQLPVVLDGVVNEALTLVKNANDANIFLYTEGRLTFGAALDSEGNRDTNFADPRPNGLTYTVAREKQMIVVENMRDHPLFDKAPADWSGSIVGLPLMMRTRVVGVMNLARSIEGAFSPSEIRLLTLLADQAAIAIVHARLHHAVSQQARIDGLTGLSNRRSLDEHLEKEINRAKGTENSFSVIMMDIDGFKLVNDVHGHDVGDDILKQISAALAHALRSSDFLARYGGDELTLILADTALAEARVVADKIHARMQSLALHLPGGQTITLGISGGIAMYPQNGDSATSLLRAADEALYLAKRGGRNRFMVAADD